MATAKELSDKFNSRVEEMKKIGAYSVEAEALIILAQDLADIALRVAMLEALAKQDLTLIVEAVLERAQASSVDRTERLVSIEPKV